MPAQTPRKWRQHLALDLPCVEEHPIWVHACSVGEVASIAPLIRALLNQSHRLHLTVVTRTGMQHAHRLFPDGVSISYLPWDLPGRMRRFIRHLSPHLLLLTETEFWPGMLRACSKQCIPVIGINTRVSDRSFPRYRATRYLWRHWLNTVDMFLAQSQLDAERLASLGVESGRIHVHGNLKYAVTTPEVNADEIRARLDPSGTRPLFIAASTHEDEESQLVAMWQAWKRIRPDLLLVLVPRHPERFEAVAEQVKSQGLRLHRWSAATPTDADAVLVDAMGVLRDLYAVADIVFIGGSLVPIGGHNPLEAAVCGRGVITGPHVQNFRTVMHEMQTCGAAIVAANDKDMDAAIQRWLDRPDELKRLHEKAAQFMQDKAQVLGRVLQALSPYLE